MGVEVGSKLEGKVTGITSFGAFVELPGGITGLVHISEIADTYVKNINEHLKVGDMVTVKVINIRDGKIGLSIKKAIDRPDVTPRHQRERGDAFEDKLNRFLKDSEDRLSSLRKHIDKKGRSR
ncbi:S1 RNA-binding domain-containing protein [Brevibacillus massiliensis]|jgi:S1 RNA binding domain protein|uniref:S1 RNA-binding domain-containing protein n=1 Tax=Brevibacillus massiliensis TaxID=1118054 RepID=UPI0002D91592|nr:S1 RNA-binding domain-containing protein [Brevibacillus massiliensis]